MPGDDANGEKFLAEFLDDYFAESDEHLTAVRRILLALESESGVAGISPAMLEELFRSFHSLKGLAGMVHLRQAELLSHHLESYLRRLRDADGILAAAGVDALIAGTDLLEQVLAARRLGHEPPSIDGVTARLSALAEARAERPAAPAAEQWIVRFAPSPDLVARGITVDRIRTRLREHGEITSATPRIDAAGGISFEFLVTGRLVPDAEIWRDQGVTIARVTPEPSQDRGEAAVNPAPGPLSALAAPPSHFVRVDLARLDELMRLIADLVITRARLADSLARVERHVPPVEWRAVQENSLAIDRHLRDLREGVVRVRMVPVGEIFRRMPFVVRDLASADKKVRLEIAGQDTEIDKFLIERMMDPILHLVRNALSHGLETTVERRASGKSDEGLLTLSAAAVGDTVVLEISDDGRGIDRVAVARRAREKGLPVPDGTLSSEELLDILCAPGFSTREAADLASGRGVGMAVVRNTVHELGGTLTLDTVPGNGTRFAIELPLTLAITDAIIGTVGARTFAVPQSAVREVIEVDPQAVRTLENNEIVPHRGGVLPLVRLADAFALESHPRRSLHVLVSGGSRGAVGVVFDRVVGQREIVVRAISDPLIRVPGVSGATDLGDGKVVLILDLPALAAGAGRCEVVRPVGGVAGAAARHAGGRS
jgi:two-component system chemotaxis sensor kinase CheA